MNQPSPITGSPLSPDQGNRLIRLFQDSFEARPDPAVSPAAAHPTQTWQPTLTDLTGRVVHALDPLLVQQDTPALPPVLRWLQPDASPAASPGPVLSPAPLSTPNPDASTGARPAAKPTL
jgi:hypothetical protein